MLRHRRRHKNVILVERKCRMSHWSFIVLSNGFIIFVRCSHRFWILMCILWQLLNSSQMFMTVFGSYKGLLHNIPWDFSFFAPFFPSQINSQTQKFPPSSIPKQIQNVIILFIPKNIIISIFILYTNPRKWRNFPHHIFSQA